MMRKILALSAVTIAAASVIGGAHQSSSRAIHWIAGLPEGLLPGLGILGCLVFLLYILEQSSPKALAEHATAAATVGLLLVAVL